jgi:hypothetical protein
LLLLLLLLRSFYLAIRRLFEFHLGVLNFMCLGRLGNLNASMLL